VNRTAGGDDQVERILPSPAHVPVVVAGARNAAMSMVVRVFGVWSGSAVAVQAAPGAQAAVPAGLERRGR
jgi:hypothetical protein